MFHNFFDNLSIYERFMPPNNTTKVWMEVNFVGKETDDNFCFDETDEKKF